MCSTPSDSNAFGYCHPETCVQGTFPSFKALQYIDVVSVSFLRDYSTEKNVSALERQNIVVDEGENM